MTFRFRPVLTLSALAALAVLLSLGFWQLQRLEWKQDLIAKTEARTQAAPIAFAEAMRATLDDRDIEYTPVAVTGRFRHDQEVHVFGALNGAAGVFVFTPLETRDGAIVYVNRGFAPQALKKAEDRAAGQITGEVRIVGLLRLPEAEDKLIRTENDIAGNLWHERRPIAFAKAQDIAAAAFYLDSLGEENAAPWPKGGVTRLDFSNRHFEYAWTWFGLAGALVGVYLAFSVRRNS